MPCLDNTTLLKQLAIIAKKNIAVFMAEHGDWFQVFSLDDCIMTFITWIQDTYHVHW